MFKSIVNGFGATIGVVIGLTAIGTVAKLAGADKEKKTPRNDGFKSDAERARYF